MVKGGENLQATGDGKQFHYDGSPSAVKGRAIMGRCAQSSSVAMITRQPPPRHG